MRIEAHDPLHRPEADIQDKGLSHNAVGLLGGTVLGVSSVAPAYALTATIGILVAEAGMKMPVVIIAGFLPMFFAAYAYREFNKVAPDCGTSFTWTTKAFGPYIGWLGGWAAVLATVIVLSNLAGVAVQFFYQFIGDLFGSEAVGALWENKLINVATCVAFLAIATAVSYRGITTTERVQYVLVGFQMVVLLVFAGMAFAKSGSSETGLSFSWDWFSPAGLTMSMFIAGLSGSIFAFWGWDTALTVNEETKDSDKTPGRAALLCVVSILLTYLLVAVATQMYAGVGTDGLGLGNEENSENVFGALAEPVMGGPLHLFLFLAVVASSAASLITTFLPTSRTMLAMGAYKAFPTRFAKIHPRFMTPSYALVVAGVGSALFYSVLTLTSENVLTDTIYSLGIMICFYYGLTAFACIWYFRRELFSSARGFVFKLLFPLLGGLGLLGVFAVTLRDSASPDYGSGASIGGVGLVLILGLGLILLGIVFMMIMRARQPAFFRGETLRKDTPVLIVDEP
ncbi:APC family permease [Mycolicibacterium parafortuitum]|uniref:Amino acid permease-associated protein [Nakamurella multipartita DSM] n=1 Tax=Mycolicibacterium parafortuitum TaxID=39692 RepID=A0A375YMR8_MYCPF|nr:APC family permease [Mycolicibacterium parafortuitum]ORB28585.1 amino acid transporter [Mycolicibacterium parafortuitum]SRX82458.1 amino acid permease-associated protein [Nakamurella multipartita DSM] [Mycolicibacterium parafortuitum]